MPFRKLNTVREGSDATLVANLYYLNKVIAFVNKLEKEGISVKVKSKG